MSDFWARRKAAVEAEAKADAAIVAQAEAAERDAALDDLSDEEILVKLDLPNPDDLGQDDDFKVFLSEAVPSRIRTRALRRLWRVNPLLANIDGLVDYGEDFTDAALVIEGMETAYQVGKGMTAHVQELARQALSDESEPSPEKVPEPEAEQPTDIQPEAPDVLIGMQDDADGAAVETAAPASLDMPIWDTEEDTTPAPIGRMRFRFEDSAQA